MRVLFYIILLVVATSCGVGGPHSVSGLDEAQAMLSVDPQKALDELSSFDIEKCNDSASIARWALLYSEAIAANRLHAPTDTIINIAIDYYGSRNLREEFERAEALKERIKSTGRQDSLATARYLQKEKEFMLLKERTRNRQYVMTGIIAALLAICIIGWQFYRLRLKEIENEALIVQAAELNDNVMRSRQEKGALASKLAGMMSGRFAMIDDLCGTYYESQGTKTERKAIAEKVKSQIESLKKDEGLFAEMEKCVNDCHDNLLVKLKEDKPDIKPDDYRLAVYLACGMSNRSIALLLGESMDVVYKRKSRLKSRLTSTGLPNVELFREIFRG